MQTLSIIGANSFIGRHLLTELQAHTVKVRVLEHKQKFDRTLHVDAETYQGNLLSLESLENFITPDATVINLAYLNRNSTQENLRAIENLAEVCAKKKIKRLIHCSTAMVYGKVKSAAIDEDSPCNPSTEYEKNKYDMEQVLLSRQQQFELAILQPTAVIGANGKNLIKLAGDLRNPARKLNYVQSCVMSKRNMHLVGVENVVAALIFLIEADLKNKKRFLIAADEDANNTFAGVEAFLQTHLALPRYKLPIFPLPLLLLTGLCKLLRKNSAQPRQKYLGKNLTALGFEKPVHLTQSLMHFCNWYKTEAAYEST